MAGKKDIQKVQVTTTANNDYATITKAMITAANACRRLMAKGIDVTDQQRQLLNIESWANSEFHRTVI